MRALVAGISGSVDESTSQCVSGRTVQQFRCDSLASNANHLISSPYLDNYELNTFFEFTSYIKIVNVLLLFKLTHRLC